MPSSADEATGQEQEVLQRKDSLRQPTSKKQKKKAKKAAAAAKLVGDPTDEVNTSEVESGTPPIDLLAPPPFREERLLSSSPEAAVSDPEPSYPDTPPIFAQEIHDDSEKIPTLDEELSDVQEPVEAPPAVVVAPNALSHQVPNRDLSPLETPGQNGVSLLQNEHGQRERYEAPTLSPSRGVFAAAVTRFTPPSPSPLSQKPQVRSPPQSPVLPEPEFRPSFEPFTQPLEQQVQERHEPRPPRKVSIPQVRTEQASPQIIARPPRLPESRVKSPPQSPRLAAPLPAMAARKLSVPDAPPPHLAQRHFNRVPEASFGLHNVAGSAEIPPGTDKYFCGFDSLDGASLEPQDIASNVLLVGSEGALDVCRYNRNRRELIGRLEGLRGSVVDAKILPVSSLNDPYAHYRPLVACVTHGPVLEDSTPEGGVSLQHGQASSITAYQTTVEVLSLKRSKHIATLFTSAPQHLLHPVGHPLFTEPAPEGSIVIAAEGQYVVVASGESGEVFIFAPGNGGPGTSISDFNCVGKYWTRTRDHVTNPQSTETSAPDQKTPDEQMRSMPIFSLSKRWLAISPPSLSSSQKSIDGSPLVWDDRPAPPGVAAYVSPPPPIVDCEVDAPSGPSLFGRVTKQATNEIRKGAQWVGEQGMSVIKGYWNRSPSVGNVQTPAPSARKSPIEDMSAGFPPTHGQGREQPTAKIEPSLVSVIDLNKLSSYDNGLAKSPLAPLATFTLNEGCSFISFSPSGLALLTANQVGDASTVWDLMRVTDARAALSLTAQHSQIAHASGLVRLVATFSRLSPSDVVDVRWTSTSNRLGILTSKGTLHLHELPRHDSLSVAVRSPASPASIPRSDLPSPSTSPQELPTGWISNVRSGWQNVSGRLGAIRSASESGGGIVTSTRQSLNQASVAARYASGRAVRNGYNSALEGAYSLRHSQDNKIRLKSVHHSVKPGCFRWLSGKDEGLVSTVADGTLCTYAVKSNYHVQGKRTIVVLDASRKAGPVQSLPGISATRLPPAVHGLLNPDGPHNSCAKLGAHGFWTLNRDNAAPSPPVRAARTAGNIQQDKETCPQYLPLHRLKQVGLFTYMERSSTKVQHALGVQLKEPWCFGESLSPVDKVTVQQSKAPRSYEAEDRAFDGMIGQMEDFSLDNGMTADPYGGRYGRSNEDLI
ncbi:hypothetical protein KVT40_004508 [Elsinoe batatas]|uniref:Uncharacterized protein n=1 Tax=Elsinoe batatas TaxID=2601811 RepID=A0A8K0L3Z7_9PEZI|nr:hypothetical protein KVT40_004508 [Elsinoe batatas]